MPGNSCIEKYTESQNLQRKSSMSDERRSFMEENREVVKCSLKTLSEILDEALAYGAFLLLLLISYYPHAKIITL